MKTIRLHISDILKKGAKLEVIKLRMTKDVRRQIEETVKEQQRLINLQNEPFKNLQITI